MVHAFAQQQASCSSITSHGSHGRVAFSAAVRPAGLQRQRVVITRATDASKLLKKPELKRPERPEAPKKLFDQQEQQQHQPGSAAAPAPAAAAAAAAPEHAVAGSSGVTVEYQRMRAKEMLKYFQEKKLQETVKDASIFGWTYKNEIGNGRWVMFGVFVGLLTEYATGVDFPHQLSLMLSYLGIVDAE